MKTFSGRTPSQNAAELADFVALLQRERVRTYLEIGARHGDTFHHIMMSLPGDAVGLAVDLPGAAWGQGGSGEHLERAVADVNTSPRRALAMFGDSGDRKTIYEVFDHGPFDAVLIDGDHRYEGVKRDWEFYGDMARVVAFHDIAGAGEVQPRQGFRVDVPELWAEVKQKAAAEGWAVHEFIATGSRMGIGVIVKNEAGR